MNTPTPNIVESAPILSPSCDYCDRWAVEARVTVDGLWYVSCDHCGISTKNFLTYDEAVGAWLKGELK